MEDTFTSDNYKPFSIDELKEKFYEAFKAISDMPERNGFILMPEMDGFTVYEIEEKTLSKLLRLVEVVRRNQTLFEPVDLSFSDIIK